jgi:hypothetical protein
MRCLLLSLFLLLAFLQGRAGTGENREAFDHSLARLNTIALLNGYIDSCAIVQKVPAFSAKEVFLVNDIIQRKFYHGYSYYSMQDNFLAYLAGKYIWGDLSAIVIPEDLVKHQMAACSQQAIVMMAVLKQRGYKVRKLGLTGHYILEVFYNNQWHVFDPNHEPKYQGIPHDSINALLANGLIIESYSKTLKPEQVKEVFKKLEVGKVNSVPAKNARIFHTVTKAISQNFILVTLGFFFGLLHFYKKKKQKKHINKLRKLEGSPGTRKYASLSQKRPLANKL